MFTFPYVGHVVYCNGAGHFKVGYPHLRAELLEGEVVLFKYRQGNQSFLAEFLEKCYFQKGCTVKAILGVIN